MATTTIPACKAAILTILAADTDLASVDRRWSPPTENEDVPVGLEAIFFGDTEIVDDNWASLGSSQGAGRRRENYRLMITVWVAQFGDDPQAAEQRAWDLWSQVYSDLRVDLFTQGGSQLRTAGVQTMGQITALQSTGVFSPSQWGARVDARVTFTATTV
jgi:hypothetical protein